MGADLVRVFAINQKTYELTPVDPLVAASGSGPRHARFLVAGRKTYFFLLAELGNIVTTYEVSYKRGSLGFKEVFSVGTHGPDNVVPAGASAAEIHVSVSMDPFTITSNAPLEILTNANSPTPSTSSSPPAT